MALANKMIDENGNIDPYVVKLVASLRSARVWGNHDFPPSLYRAELQWCKDRAEMMRLSWRRDHGLPDDSPVEWIVDPIAS